MSIRITSPEEDRYHRLRIIQWWDQEKLTNANVLVVGAGALGNEVVKNLALLGIGRVWIVDFDLIETSNLTRSVLFRAQDVGQPKARVLAMRAAEINPDSTFEPLLCDARFDLGLGFLRGMNLIFGCVDNREARYYMNRNCYLLRKPLIDGGLDTLNGSVTLFQPPETPCYECTLTATDRAELQKRISCLRSTVPEIKEHIPTTPTIASLTGALQAQIGIRLLHGLSVPAGRRLGLYGLSDVFFDIRLEMSEDCGLHASVDPLPEESELLPLTENDPLSLILAEVRTRWNGNQILWDYDRDLITQLTCMKCGTTSDFVGTQSMYQRAGTCPCGGVYKAEISNSFHGIEPWGSRSFRELGFPADHIYCAFTESGRRYFRLGKGGRAGN